MWKSTQCKGGVAAVFEMKVGDGGRFKCAESRRRSGGKPYRTGGTVRKFLQRDEKPGVEHLRHGLQEIYLTLGNSTLYLSNIDFNPSFASYPYWLKKSCVSLLMFLFIILWTENRYAAISTSFCLLNSVTSKDSSSGSSPTAMYIGTA